MMDIDKFENVVNVIKFVANKKDYNRKNLL